MVIMSKYCKVGYIPISTATYRIGKPSITNIYDYKKAEKFLDNGDAVNRYLCNLFPYDLKYDKKGQKIYKNKTLLSIAYKNADYKSAKKYASELFKDGIRTIKVLFSLNLILFKIFIYAKTKIK